MKVDIFALSWHRVDNKIPNFIKTWLIDNDSLTRKLKKLHPDFLVKVLNEEDITIDYNILGESKVIKREVNLCAGDKKLIYAVSFIPKNCIDLINIGNQPLGEILFQNAIRESIEITKTQNTWGRRSIFLYKNHKIMVCEFFMPSLSNTNHQK
jgi:chorismate-pyruvate lyase